MPPPAATPPGAFRLLPPEVRASLGRATRRLWGLGLIAVAAVVAYALLTYDPADPSLNTAGPSAVSNALGTPGAVMADLLLQTVGLAAAVPVIVLVAWGLRLLAGRGVGWLWLRGLAIIALLLLAAMGLAAVGRPLSWPLTSSLGGFAGPLLVEAAQGLAVRAGAGDNLRWLFSLLAGVGVLLLLPWSLAFRFRDLGDMARGLRRLPSTLGVLWRGAAPDDGEPDDGDESHLPLLRRPAMRPPEPPPPPSMEDGGQDVAGGRAGLSPVAAPTRPDTSLVMVPPPKAPPRRDPEPRQASLLPLAEAVNADAAFLLPPLTLLAPPAVAGVQVDREALAQNARLLEGVLSDFGVHGQIVQVRPGPVVTLYELEPAPGTKTSRVVGLADDIARSMSALAVRIAVVPGKSTIGIELPNTRRQTVNFRELLAADAMAPHGSAQKGGADGGDPGLVLALGRDIGGEPVTVDLARMPHLLIAGTTGSGKSVAVNTMICSLLYRLSPEEVRFIMIDPKMLELSVYDGIPHLLSPVVTDPGKAVVALKWAVKEMENRYRAMSQFGVRNIAGYNGRLREAAAKGQQLTRTVQVGFDPETGQPTFEEQALDMTPLPFVVVIVDEMADLMLVAGKDVEAAIQRLAQMARAAGIHLIMATQRPSVDVITGTIKANFPTRISFQVTSKIDSRTILGEQGAEQLLGQGDMLYMAPGGRVTRVHGPFIADVEVEQVVAHLRAQGAPDYVAAVTDENEQGSSTMLDAMTGGTAGAGGGDGEDQALFDQAVALVARERKASTSFVQRYLQIGYNRAARLIERMEAEGMVSKPNRVGKREVLLPPAGED